MNYRNTTESKQSHKYTHTNTHKYTQIHTNTHIHTYTHPHIQKYNTHTQKIPRIHKKYRNKNNAPTIPQENTIIIPQKYKKFPHK